MERCVNDRLLIHVWSTLYTYEHGFMKGRSTCSQLLEFFDHLGKSPDVTGQTDVIYLDFAKAFDNVNHFFLLYILQKMYSVKDHLLK